MVMESLSPVGGQAGVDRRQLHVVHAAIERQLQANSGRAGPVSEVADL